MAGRGRGFNINNRDENPCRRMLRRPMDVEEGPLRKTLNELSLSETDISAARTEVEKMSTSEENLKIAVHLIYKYSHQSKKHAKLGAVLFAELNNLQSGNMKVRDILLKKLQNDFKENDKIIPDPKKFLHEVNFLCEIFCTLKINESPIVVLGQAVMIYFERLLDGKEEELKVLLEQVPKLAEDLIMCNDNQFKDFLLKIRKKLIIDTEMNIASRTVLLAVLECCLKRTKHLETEVETFYENLSGLHLNE